MEEPRVAIVRSYRPAHGVSNARAVTARRVRLTRRMSIEEAFRATVLECLAQVGGNAPAIRAHEPRGIHQIRVGLRRLQMAPRLTRRSSTFFPALRSAAMRLVTSLGVLTGTP